MELYHISSIAGSVILTTVLIKYCQKETKPNITLSTILSLIGFILVSGSVWNNISLKTSSIELALIKESEAQMESYVHILSGYENLRNIPEHHQIKNQKKHDWLDLNTAASKLEAQRKLINEALRNNNLEKALLEMKKGSEIVKHVELALKSIR